MVAGRCLIYIYHRLYESVLRVSTMATSATTRRRIRYHCIVCCNECKKRSIQCVDCGRWTHIDCVRFHQSVLDVRSIAFVCRTCAFNGEEYDWDKSLIRLVQSLSNHIRYELCSKWQQSLFFPICLFCFRCI